MRSACLPATQRRFPSITLQTGLELLTALTRWAVRVERALLEEAEEAG